MGTPQLIFKRSLWLIEKRLVGVVRGEAGRGSTLVTSEPCTGPLCGLCLSQQGEESGGQGLASTHNPPYRSLILGRPLPQAGPPKGGPHCWCRDPWACRGQSSGFVRVWLQCPQPAPTAGWSRDGKRGQRAGRMASICTLGRKRPIGANRHHHHSGEK